MSGIVDTVVSDAYNADFSSVKARLSPQMTELLTPAAVIQVSESLHRLGTLKSVTIDSSQIVSGYTEMSFTAHMTEGTAGGTVDVDSGGTIVGMQFPPRKIHVEAREFLNYVTKARVMLPFRGAWYAAGGGIDPAKNSEHASDKVQQYAYDFVIVKNGSTHSGDGSRNEDYYDYSEPVLAPVSGTVVTLVDGVPQNRPGQMNSYFLTGNSVIIDDGLGEWALIAHLQPNRLQVKLGDKVTAGQVIGYCGNSGNSTEPHIHFHMMNALDMAAAEGLPVTFQEFVQDGKPVKAGVAGGQVMLENAPAGR